MSSLKNPLQGITIFLFLLPVCLFFPYHSTFFALVCFGIWHIFIELRYWFSNKEIHKSPNRVIKIIPIGALFFSIWAIVTFLLGKSGIQTGLTYIKINLSLLGIWFFFSALEYTSLFCKKNFIILLVASLFITSVWVRPMLSYFFLVHSHNIFPWVFLFHSLKNTGKFNKRNLLLTAVLFTIVIPIIGAMIFLLSNFQISEISLSYELEEEVFKQIVSSELSMVPGTLLLGLFAYQQMLHYFLWIVAIPKTAIETKAEILFEKHNPIFLNKAILPVMMLIGILLFYYFPVDFRKLYFAIGFFHISIELPLLFRRLS